MGKLLVQSLSAGIRCPLNRGMTLYGVDDYCKGYLQNLPRGGTLVSILPSLRVCRYGWNKHDIILECRSIRYGPETGGSAHALDAVTLVPYRRGPTEG